MTSGAEEEGRSSTIQKFHDLKLTRRPSMLKRIASQEEYNPVDDDETFIQTHRQASGNAPLSSRSKMSIITTCSSEDSEVDEHGRITPLGSMRKSVSISSVTSVGSLKAGRQFSSENSSTMESLGTTDGDIEEDKSYDFDEEDDDEDDGESSRILFDKEEPDLSDI
jgi:hypothetical protein